MTSLGIDGALGSFSAAVVRDDSVLSARARTGNVALESGLDMIAHVLEEAHVAGAGLDRIAVGIGPGSFTGLRIAISYAKSLAFAWNVPLVAASSFAMLEEGRVFKNHRLSVVSGRVGVISARYCDGGEQRRASGRIEEALDQLLPAPSGETLTVVGAGEDVLAALAERGYTVKALTPLLDPAAVAAAYIGSQLDPAQSVHAVRADYGELPAARVPNFSKAP